MSVRLSRKHSDALSAEDTQTPPKGRKAAASPAGGSRKKKVAAGASARTPSPAGPPSKAASSSGAAAAVAAAAPRGKARRNAQPDSSPPLGRPRHLNDPDDGGAEEDDGPQATDDEDLRLSGESDNESVGSRAMRAPVRSRSRSNAKGGSNVFHEAASSSNARAKPASSVSWGPDASASPVGTWTDNLSYPAVAGSNESGGPARKNSDARRAATAERERIGAQTRKQLFEQQKAKDAAAAAARGQRGCFAKLVSFVLWTVMICGAAVGAAFLAFQSSLPTDSSSGGRGGASNRDAVSAVSSELAALFPRLQPQIERVLDPALRHHADSFVGLDDGAASGSDAAAERSWLEGSLAAFAHPKPLVIVLATDGTSKSRGMDARTVMRALHAALEANAGQATAEPLALLELGQADATLQQLRDKLSAHFAAASQPASAASDLLASWADSLLSVVHSVAPGLGGLAGGSSASSSASRLASSLSRGLVFVSGAGRFPRSAAEAFHLWVDDVAAPQPRAAFVFEVDVSAVRQAGAQQQQMRAADAVQRTLERQWEQGKVPRDEVIRPLLGRIVRNVVDLTSTAAP